MKAINLRNAEELGVHQQQIAANISLRSDCALCCLLGPSVETIPGVNRQI